MLAMASPVCGAANKTATITDRDNRAECVRCATIGQALTLAHKMSSPYQRKACVVTRPLIMRGTWRGATVAHCRPRS
jgi:hypothetical protein